MDIHPWMKYEIARMRDEERLLRARAAAQVREARSEPGEVGEMPQVASWFDRLRRRDVAVEQPTIRARPV